MSQTIDDRVVQLTFDNKQFESGVATSLKTLDKLDKSLDLKNGSKGLESIGKAADGIDLTHLQDSVDALNKKFSVTGTIGRTVVQELTKDAMNLAKNGFKKITSSITAPCSALASRQPTVRPGIAAGVSAASNVTASEIRNYRFSDEE